MQITHLGHSTVLVETGEARILIDPGVFSDAWHRLRDLDAILVTHQHPDHADPANLPVLIAANPQALVAVETTVPDHVQLPEEVVRLGAGMRLDFGALRVETIGGQHAVIHRDYPRIGNVGLVIRQEGEPSLLHPGDSLDAVAPGINVAMIPAFGPWAATRETIDFTRAVGAAQGFLIHDGLLNERGIGLIKTHLTKLCQISLVDLRDQLAWNPGL